MRLICLIAQLVYGSIRQIVCLYEGYPRFFFVEPLLMLPLSLRPEMFLWLFRLNPTWYLRCMNQVRIWGFPSGLIVVLKMRSQFDPLKLKSNSRGGSIGGWGCVGHHGRHHHLHTCKIQSQVIIDTGILTPPPFSQRLSGISKLHTNKEWYVLQFLSTIYKINYVAKLTLLQGVHNNFSLFLWVFRYGVEFLLIVGGFPGGPVQVCCRRQISRRRIPGKKWFECLDIMSRIYRILGRIFFL